MRNPNKYVHFEYANLSIGQSAELTKKISQKDIERFAEISGDKNPIHLDDEYAKNSIFGKKVAHGLLAVSMISTILGTKLPGPGSIYLKQEVKFLKPVFPGDTITAKVTVTKKFEEKKRVELSTSCSNQNNETVLDGTSLVQVER
ncbi:MAG TPA: MaoC family dehydratase [archaeon]|nr:MaoC family dehydratase [archaeon]